MTWIRHKGRHISGADGYRFEIWRKFSDTWVLEQYENGRLILATTHSTLRSAKSQATLYYERQPSDFGR